MNHPQPPALPPTNNTLHQLNHLGCIEATGKDAALFLQGQVSCNINDLSLSNASIAAFCNPKGRVISTLLIIKTAEGFLLILPQSLVDKVLKKLQMYVLRAAVTLRDKSTELNVLGLNCPIAPSSLPLPLEPFTTRQTSSILIKLPSTTARYLAIGDFKSLTDLSTQLQQCGFTLDTQDAWRYQDISAGFPWFEADQSEQYIPQVLNIDHLGGVSFNKGCYTGQEIIARTHYLGKAKRSLFLAECNQCLADNDTAILDADTQQSVGDILVLQNHAGKTRLLAVLQNVDEAAKNLILADAEQTRLTLIPYH